MGFFGSILYELKEELKEEAKEAIKETARNFAHDVIYGENSDNAQEEISEDVPISIAFTPFPNLSGVFSDDARDGLVKKMLKRFGGILGLEGLFSGINYKICYDGGTPLAFVVTNGENSIIYGMYGMGCNAITVYGNDAREIAENIQMFFEENDDFFSVDGITTDWVDYHENDKLLSLKDDLVIAWIEKQTEILEQKETAKEYISYQTKILCFLFGWQSEPSDDDIERVAYFGNLIYKGNDLNVEELSRKEMKKLQHKEEKYCFEWLLNLYEKDIIALSRALYATCFCALEKEYLDILQKKQEAESNVQFIRWCKNFCILRKKLYIDEFDEDIMPSNLPMLSSCELKNTEFHLAIYELNEEIGTEEDFLKIIKKIGEEK